MKHSIVTVSYNSAGDLKKHWSTFNRPSNVEWIVVDNNSSDDSVATARELGADVVPLPSNLGFGAANNEGLFRSKGSSVWFVNPDVEVVAEDLDVLSRVAHDEGALVAPQLVNDDGSLQPNGRRAPFLLYKVLNRVAEARVSRRYHVYASGGAVERCDWLIGAVVGGQREVLSALGPWDPTFFVYYEDSDLGLRAARAGVPSMVVGECRWTHAWARETTALSLPAWKLEFGSMFKFYRRYPRLLLPPIGRRHHSTAQGKV